MYLRDISKYPHSLAWTSRIRGALVSLSDMTAALAGNDAVPLFLALAKAASDGGLGESFPREPAHLYLPVF